MQRSVDGMSSRPTTVLVFGATGSIGTLAVSEALRQGYVTRALVRDPGAAQLPDGAEVVVGELTDASTLGAALDGVDALVFTHGSHGTEPAVYEAVDYGAVLNALEVLAGRPVRIAQMTALGVTDHTGPYDWPTEVHDWKRRAERLVRASGNAYTIVRPGWFDYNEADEHRLVFRQGDTHHAGDSSDGVIARAQIARVLIDSLSVDAADRKTFELVAERGEAQADLTPLFAALDADAPGSLDGAHDPANFPEDAQPERVRAALRSLGAF